MSNDYPYADRYPVNRGMPERGRSREEITAELATVEQVLDRTHGGAVEKGVATHQHPILLLGELEQVAGLELDRDLLAQGLGVDLDRLVGAAVAELELEGLGPAGEGQELMLESEGNHGSGWVWGGLMEGWVVCWMDARTREGPITVRQSGRITRTGRGRVLISAGADPVSVVRPVRASPARLAATPGNHRGIP